MSQPNPQAEIAEYFLQIVEDLKDQYIDETKLTEEEVRIIEQFVKWLQK